ncbi:MAG: YbaB/EbfC family nucleoid-associated protein [Candidatus Omnitrophica bacterium]|nr:YbaB/EbfC family nucleoid-associated protein [Candidatus Omnitrophota bacterium]
MLDKLKNIYEAQKKMTEIKKGLEEISVDHESAAGKIKITMSGTQRVVSIKIDDEMLQAAKAERLEKELVLAINAASEKVQKMAAQKLQASMGNFKIPGL